METKLQKKSFESDFFFFYYVLIFLIDGNLFFKGERRTRDEKVERQWRALKALSKRNKEIINVPLHTRVWVPSLRFLILGSFS